LVAYSPVRIISTPKPIGIEYQHEGAVMNYEIPKLDEEFESTPQFQRAPADIPNFEELVLAAQRIDQFHDPIVNSEDYWKEALRRDQGSIAANKGYGLLKLKRGLYAEAEQHYLKAINRLTARFTSPKDVEPFYQLGVALRGQGRLDEAFTAFYKAAWGQDWKSPAYFELAELASIRGDYLAALEFVSNSIDANGINVRAYGLKSALLRKLGRTEEASQLIAYARPKTDQLDVLLQIEQWLSSKNGQISNELVSTWNNFPATLLETASEYYNAGLWNDGEQVLLKAIEVAPDKKAVSPLVYYYLGYFADKQGNPAKAVSYRNQTKLQSIDYSFPFQFELVDVLESAFKANPKDGLAYYFLGNLLYDTEPDVAITKWEKSAELDPSNAISWRNLALGYTHQEDATLLPKAVNSLERAVSLPNPYATHLVELDKLYQGVGIPVEKRLGTLSKNLKLVTAPGNDETLGRLINILTFTGKTDAAINYLKGRTFSIWEAPTPYFYTGQAWADANFTRGLQNINAKKYREAIADFEAVLNVPENLRAEQQFNQHKIAIAYWIGVAYAALGEKAKAEKSWKDAISGNTKKIQGVGTGGGRVKERNPLLKGEDIYYQALANEKLGKVEGDKAAFNELLTIGAEGLATDVKFPPNASLVTKEYTKRRNTALAHYVSGLGQLGLGNKAKAKAEFNAALQLLPDFIDAKNALKQL